jgi:transmembrane sensor
MRKEILLKYVSGDASQLQQEEVLAWAAKDKANELYLARLQNLWVSQNIPQGQASAAEIEKMMRLLEEKIQNEMEPATVKKQEIQTAPKRATSGQTETSGTYHIKKWVVWVAAASVMLFFSAGLYFWEFTNNSASGLTAENTIGTLMNYKNTASTKVLYTEKGVKAKLLLPDSSVVWLNSDTRIEYPDKFDSLVRNVTISGEAYFDVVKNPHRPMIVKTTKGFSVQVLGTQFNLKAYEDESKSQATLYSGEINLLRESGNKIITTKVLPFQTVTINSKDLKYPIRKVLKQSPLDDAAWKEGKIIFEETPVHEVVKILERWHGIEFVIGNKDILQYKITATFNSESIVQIMDLIQMTSLVSYKIDNKKVFLSKK